MNENDSPFEMPEMDIVPGVSGAECIAWAAVPIVMLILLLELVWLW